MEALSTPVIVPLHTIVPNPFQPEGRIAIEDAAAEKMADSIIAEGMYQAPVVRKTADGYEMADGWRRLAGYRWLFRNRGLMEYGQIPVIVRELDDRAMADIILTTNDERQDLNPIERAQVFRRYLATFPEVTQAEFAIRRGTSQAEVANTMRLLDLPEPVRKMVISREITESHGRELLRVKLPAVQLGFASDAAKEGLSVRELASRITLYLKAMQPEMEIPEPVREAAAEPVTDIEAERGYDISGEPIEKEPTVTSNVIDEPFTGENDTSPEAPAIPRAAESETAGEGGKEEPSDESLTEDALETEPVPTPEEKPASDESTAGTSAPVSSPAPKAPAATPGHPVTASPPLKASWGRKLVIEEKDGSVMMSVMKAGGTPEFWKRTGDIYGALTSAEEWLAALEQKWDKEGK